MVENIIKQRRRALNNIISDYDILLLLYQTNTSWAFLTYKSVVSNIPGLVNPESYHVKVLGQKYPSDGWLPSDTSKNPTSPINHPSTTMPPQKTGYLTEFEKGQIVAFLEKKKSLFQKLESSYIVLRVQFKLSIITSKRGVMQTPSQNLEDPQLSLPELVAA